MRLEMLGEAVLDALAVLAPVACAGCGAEDRAVCGACRSALRPEGMSTRLEGDLVVRSSLPYEGVPRRVILALKEQGRTDAVRALAPALAASIASAVAGDVELTAVPPSPSAYRRRGYDPVRMLLRGAHLPCGASLLRTARTTERQKSLDREQRRSNLVGSMVSRGRLDGRRIVVVDDVLTTGATLIEAARAVSAAGGTVVAAATLAATPRRLPASL